MRILVIPILKMIVRKINLRFALSLLHFSPWCSFRTKNFNRRRLSGSHLLLIMQLDFITFLFQKRNSVPHFILTRTHIYFASMSDINIFLFFYSRLQNIRNRTNRRNLVLVFTAKYVTDRCVRNLKLSRNRRIVITLVFELKYHGVAPLGCVLSGNINLSPKLRCGNAH